MAGLAAAWRLSSPERRQDVTEVTVYQRGWRLGGKGASGRGPNGRIEEHGLHVWLGYYDNAFRLVREVYEALDRPGRNPAAPIKTWSDAFQPAGTLALTDWHEERVQHWVAQFSADRRLPGQPGQLAAPLTTLDFVRRAISLISDFVHSLGGEAPLSLGDAIAKLARITVLSTVAEVSSLLSNLLPQVEVLRGAALRALELDARTRRSFHLVDLILTSLVGIGRDGLLTAPGGFSAIDDQEYRAWMRRHGCAESTLQSPLVAGVYDLVFGYEDGDRSRPRFSAGLGLVLSARLFFDYRGAIFWKMRAGMGDVVFAPLYEALRDRGVQFEFFRDVRSLHLACDGQSISHLRIARQARLLPVLAHYEPLTDVLGLPCWPAAPLREQIVYRRGQRLDRAGLESTNANGLEDDDIELIAGRDYDAIVFALPIGVVPVVCAELVAHRPRWRRMVENLGVVATQSFQLWLRESHAALGAPAAAITLSGFVEPFETWSTMDALIEAEDWPSSDRPKSLAYFCGALRAPTAGMDPMVGATDEHVLASIRRFVEHDLHGILPGVRDERTGSFRWDVLHATPSRQGSDRLLDQFFQANTDPSDLYVQSLPGTDRFRLRADESGYTNLFLAGDWTDSGLNAGCIESAVMSGLRAANAVTKQGLNDGVAGAYAL
jgi:uncharacterized protein with NAD-binding domain and iron-sulfur cluster